MGWTTLGLRQGEAGGAKASRIMPNAKCQMPGRVEHPSLLKIGRSLPCFRCTMYVCVLLPQRAVPLGNGVEAGYREWSQIPA